MRRNGLIEHMRKWATGIIVAITLVLPSCENTSFRSSVPVYPVRVIIDTRVWAFVHFQPTVLNSHIVVNRNGFFMDGKYVLPVTTVDAWGYGGVVAYVGLNGYCAFDLACPYCAGRGSCHPCEVSEPFAVCPFCGEEYDLGSGLAMPQHGISHETLRPLNIFSSDGKLTITQRQ